MKRIILTVIIILTDVFAQKTLDIDLSNQTFEAKEKGEIVIQGKVTSGRAGYLTPKGTFKIMSKEKMHVSNRYPIKDKELNIRGGAKMPYAQRITGSGVFIHVGTLVKHPDSHGCIRVSYGDGMKLFTWTDKRTTVTVKGKTPLSDPINQMRLSIKKTKKNTKQHTKKQKNYVFIEKPIKWVEGTLNYYDNL